MTIVKAEAGIEMPKFAGNGAAKYPWKTMEVGESFIVTTPSPNAHYNMALASSKIYAPKKFRSGKDKDGNRRVWRIE